MLFRSINFVLNIQKITNDRRFVDEEKYFYDTFILLITKAFQGLRRNLAKRLKSTTKKFYEDKDLDSDAILTTIELILGFDPEKNNSFIGYLTRNLELGMRTRGRTNKMDASIQSESSLSDGFLESIPDTTVLTHELENEENLANVRKCVEELQGKERDAVKKALYSDEKLTETEQRAKRRGFDRVREMMSKET